MDEWIKINLSELGRVRVNKSERKVDEGWYCVNRTEETNTKSRASIVATYNIDKELNTNVNKYSHKAPLWSGGGCYMVKIECCG